jgi:hypothetical protein
VSCVDLIGSYTLKGKGRTIIDIMCLIKNNPATSGFEIVKIPTVEISTVPSSGKGKKATCILN